MHARRCEARGRLRHAALARPAGQHHSLTRRRLALGDPWVFEGAAWGLGYVRFNAVTQMCVTFYDCAMATNAAARRVPRRASGRAGHARMWACIRCVLVIYKL